MNFRKNFAFVFKQFCIFALFFREIFAFFFREMFIIFRETFAISISRNFRDFYIAKQIEAKFCEKNENIHVFRADWYWTGNTSTQQYRDFYQMHHFFQFFKIIWSQCLPRQLGSWPKLLKLWYNMAYNYWETILMIRKLNPKTYFTQVRQIPQCMLLRCTIKRIIWRVSYETWQLDYKFRVSYSETLNNE